MVDHITVLTLLSCIQNSNLIIIEYESTVVTENNPVNCTVYNNKTTEFQRKIIISQNSILGNNVWFLIQQSNNYS